jgi:hypothetical protein
VTLNAGLGSTTLYHYDLSQSKVVGSVSLGNTQEQLPARPTNPHEQGWDVSADGSHVVYQRATTNPSDTQDRATTSSFWYAAADFSGTRQILESLSTHDTLRLSLSPDGKSVAATDDAVYASPGLATTGSVTSSGGSGDPTYHTYMPSAGDLPVWFPDGSAFYATAQGGAAIDRYTVGKATGALFACNSQAATAAGS